MICDKLSNQLILATGGGQEVYPVIVVEVDGNRCRALLDTGAGSSQASAALISKLDRKPDRREYKIIEMMMTWTNQKIEMYKVQVSNVKRSFQLAHYPEQSGKGNFANYPVPEICGYNLQVPTPQGCED